MYLRENERVKGHILLDGFTILIEYKKGDKKHGKNKKTGQPWVKEFFTHYGYFENAGAPDGDNLDVYVVPRAKAKKPIYVFHNLTPDGSAFDEDKVFMGCNNLDQAKLLWKMHVHEPEKMWGGVCEFTTEEFSKILNRMQETSQGIIAKPDCFYSLKNKGFLPENLTSLAFNEYLHNS